MRKMALVGAPAVLLLCLAAVAFAGDVTNERLLQSQDDPESWLMYGRNYSAWRYSELDQINTSTVKQLAPAWIFQTGVGGRFQTTPLVSDGLMYVTGHSNHAWALDLRPAKEKASIGACQAVANELKSDGPLSSSLSRFLKHQILMIEKNARRIFGPTSRSK